MRISAVGSAFPPNYYDQETLIAAFKEHWGTRHHNLERLESLHRHALVGGRHLALEIEEYRALDTFGKTNDAFIRVATDLGASALDDGLRSAGLTPRDVDHVFFVTTTGIATPSIDARIVNRLGLRTDVKRSPLFGLGCVAGAAAVARAADYLRAYPSEVAVVVSVELCSLTLQREDLSIPNIIASGLFGDGAAAVVIVGGEGEPSAQRVGESLQLSGPGGGAPGHSGNGAPTQQEVTGPEIVATRSVFYRETEHLMGWDVTSEGFRVVLSGEIPRVVRENLRSDVEAFLGDNGVRREDVRSYVCHTGGPRILEAFQEALELEPEALAPTWRSLREIGNVSSASVLLVLGDVLKHHRPAAGAYGVMMAMGPGFCSELVLLRW